MLVTWETLLQVRLVFCCGTCAWGLACIGKQLRLSLLAFHILAVQNGKLSCAPTKTRVWFCSGSRLSVDWETYDIVAVTARRQSWSGWLGQMRVWEPGTWTKVVQLRRAVRKVLLVISPGSCQVSKINSSPDWAAVYNISEQVCIQSPYSTILKWHPQQLQ